MRKRDSVKDRLQPVIASEMKRFREENNWTQAELAKKLFISTRCYIDLERGINFPSALTLALFMTMLDEEKQEIFLTVLREADYQK